MSTGEDPFGTAELRRRVLDAWVASPARFREDANAEDDLVRGGYRDRVVVELAQNAADAAARARVPGRLVLRLADGVLTASNTGSPLDAAGVESLSTLRASSKRDVAAHAAVGRFGVGFAAVLAVTDAPEIASTTGAVRWDADLARADVAALVPLADEAGRRAGQLPVLRLPRPSSALPDDGFTTTVRLPLRDAAAVELAGRLLTDVDDALLLALPTLESIEVDVDGARRVVADAGRWRVVRRAGELDPALLADRPVEERARPWWNLAWALPLAGQPVPDVLHAPTPTDEPLDLPALLFGSFPLDPTRRHVAPGPLTAFLVGEAAVAYAELAREVDEPLSLLPGPVPVGRLDGALREALTTTLQDTPLLHTTEGGRTAPRGATSVVGAGRAVCALLAEAVGPLVDDDPALDRLSGRRLRLSEAVEQLGHLDRPPSWWLGFYAALDVAEVRDPEVLGVLPVPLADGRLVHGPRRVLLPEAGLGVDPDALRLLGVRVAHPAAVHPLLRRAGAADAGPRTVLDVPEVRGAVEAAWDDPDPTAVAEAVLSLVAAAHLRPGELPWLATLPLPDRDGEPAQADELVRPGSPLAALADPDAVGVVAGDLAERWAPDTLAAVGVLDHFTVTELEDVVLDLESVDEQLAGWASWVLATVRGSRVPPTARSVPVVPELDVVADDRWPDALRALSSDPDVREAVVDPVRLDLGDGRSATVPSYGSWLLRDRALLAGRRTTTWSLPADDVAGGLYDALDPRLVAGVDPEVLVAAGVRRSLADVLTEPGGADEVLRRLADSDRTVPASALHALWPVLARLDVDDVTPPERVRLAPDVVVDAGEVVVVDRPEHLQVLGEREALVVPLRVADRIAEVLDLDLSSGVVRAPRLEDGTEQPVPAVLTGLVPDLPATWWEHDDLTAGGRPVSWWRDERGAVHAATLDGLARGLAAAAGRWESRLLLAEALETPVRVAELVAEARLEG